MGNWSSQFNVAHALTANLGTGNLNTTTVANLALMADTLVLTAMTLPVTSWSKDALTEQTILLRL